MARSQSAEAQQRTLSVAIARLGEAQAWGELSVVPAVVAVFAEVGSVARAAFEAGVVVALDQWGHL